MSWMTRVAIVGAGALWALVQTPALAQSQMINARVSGNGNGNGGGKCTFEVVVQGRAEVQIRGNQGGVYVHDNGQGTLEDNEITGNGETGVEISTDGSPSVRGNRINRNEYQAVWVHERGMGVIEDNDLTGNIEGAWLIAKDCKPNVTRARNKE